MPVYQKSGSPFLYDQDTDEIVGVKDPDGGERLFAQSFPSKQIPKHTGFVKRTNIANGVSYAMSNSAGARENFARRASPTWNFVPAGGLRYIGVGTCADYSEGEGDANMRSLNGTKMQIAVEYPPLSGHYITAYADLQNKVLTKQFGTEKTVFDFVCPVNVDIPEDAICHVTIVCQ